MTRVLVTGGAGFVGTNLVARLAESGDYSVVVLDNETVGTQADIDAPIERYIKGSILDEDQLTSVAQEADVIVHLAGMTRVVESVLDPWPTFETNALGTFRVLSACRSLGVGKLLCASTGGAIIGEADGKLHEEMMPRPIAPYGASKLAAEGYCSAFSGSYGVNAASLRFSNVYGPRSFRKASVVAAFYLQILAGKPCFVYGDGSQVRDYVFVDDLADGIIKGIEMDCEGVYQLGSGQSVSVNELLDTMREVVGSKFPVEVRYEPPRAGEVASVICDISKARRLLDYNPTTELRDGLERTWAWFLDNRDRLGL